MSNTAIERVEGIDPRVLPQLASNNLRTRDVLLLNVVDLIELLNITQVMRVMHAASIASGCLGLTVVLPCSQRRSPSSRRSRPMSAQHSSR